MLRFPMRRLLFPTVIAVAIAGAAHAERHVLDPSKVVAPRVSGKAAIGKMSYDLRCAECHGTNGVGTEKGPPFLNRYYHPGHHGDAAFFRAVRQGVRAHHWNFGAMKPLPEVNDAQIANIVEYVRELQRANGLF